MLYISVLKDSLFLKLLPSAAYGRCHLSNISAKQKLCFHSDFRMNHYALGRRRGVRISQPGLKARAAVAPALLLFLHDRFAGSCRSIFLPCSGPRCPPDTAKARLTPTARFITTKVVLPLRFPNEPLRPRLWQATTAFGVAKATGFRQGAPNALYWRGALVRA